MCSRSGEGKPGNKGTIQAERLRYSSHIPECTVLTSTRMKNHT